MKHGLTIVLTVLMSFFQVLVSKRLDVPSQYVKIQEAIGASANGDTVVVAPGVYKENIRFGGKNIVVGSNFVLDRNPKWILSTVIDGSSPKHPDTTSCVIIINGENNSAMLMGFTLTKGKGTRWLDEHGAGVYREGGGILTALSSPTIAYNIIDGNEAINSAGFTGAGGGGIRAGDGAPIIRNNIIIRNQAMYGGGIVLNYCSGAVVQNNIIAQNSVFQAIAGVATYGGGGVWINNKNGSNTTPNRIDNNTIVSNISTGDAVTGSAGSGGAIVIENSAIGTARNNIIWKNSQTRGNSIYSLGSTFSLTFSTVEDGFTGSGNISQNPMFDDSLYLLSPSSPCVDAGDPSLLDPENPSSTGNALFPSRGAVRSDMGAYGGPLTWIPPTFSFSSLTFPQGLYDFGFLLPGESAARKIFFFNSCPVTLNIDSVRLAKYKGNDFTVTSALPKTVRPLQSDTMVVSWLPTSGYSLADTLFFYTSGEGSNVFWVSVSGTSQPTASISMDVAECNIGDIDINTVKRDTTFYINNIGTADDSVYLSLSVGSLNPPTAARIATSAAKVKLRDSSAIVFTVNPSTIVKNFTGVYTLTLIVDSRFGVGTTHFEKTIRFRLVGTKGIEVEQGLIRSYELSQNYPNPFNPSTTIRYALPSASHVRITISDVLGKVLTELVNARQSAGSKELSWNAKNIPSGTYFYRIEAVSIDNPANVFVETRKMTVLK
jgi:hypothetical protein